MKLAILFWIYKDPRVCVNRAKLLRRLNPGMPVFCLYGGPIDEAPAFARALDGLVDDFYVFPEPWEAKRKWFEGDKLIAAWHRDRGVLLDWDTVFIAQWDMVMLEPVSRICGSLGRDEVMFPGTRRISDVRCFWNWLQSEDGHLGDYEAFCDLLRARGVMPSDPLCCNFLAATLPRSFLDRYSAEAPDEGFLEYKVTMLAQAWGFAFHDGHRLDPIWVHERRRSRLERYLMTLHAEKETIPAPVIFSHALRRNGRRVFHPFHGRVPLSLALLSAA